jgi:hypothetical protein
MKNGLIFTILIGLTALTGCCAAAVQQQSSASAIAPIEVVEVTENPVPGTVSQPWVEPMFDQVEVPAQLDPAATYYRLPHKTTYEIRTDRVEGVNYEGGK